MEILSVKNLNFTYPLCENKALDDISFSVGKGDMVVVCGATGSGKTTLLRMLKKELTPQGTLSGSVEYMEKPLEELSPRECAAKIGYVMQRPEQQIVTDKVWHELAFGLESLGVSTDTIRRRVAEMAAFFGIESWFDKNVSELSSGQMQLLNLASVMAMQPEILLLDEPTAQLDPVASADFLSTVARLNRELSLTVIMVEHRLEDVLPMSNKLLALENGRIVSYGETRATVASLKTNEDMLDGMPAAVKFYSRFDFDVPCPLDVREGRDLIERSFKNDIRSLKTDEYTHNERVALEFSDVFFRYKKELPDVLSGLSFKVYEGEIFCLLGGNGSGKSTTLMNACALLKPYSGSIKVFGKKLSEYKNQSLYRECVSLLPQDVQTVFLKNTVREELEEVHADLSSFPFDMSSLLGQHPYDLSGGQQQIVALAKVLAAKPRLLFLDEPTKGLDAHSKKIFTDIIKKLKADGMTVVCVSHDMDFAASCADRCALFFRGEIISRDIPRVFFSGNSFYTTAANRMTRGLYDLVATVDDAEAICRANERIK